MGGAESRRKKQEQHHWAADSATVATHCHNAGRRRHPRAAAPSARAASRAGDNAAAASKHSLRSSSSSKNRLAASVNVPQLGPQHLPSRPPPPPPQQQQQQHHHHTHTVSGLSTPTCTSRSSSCFLTPIARHSHQRAGGNADVADAARRAGGIPSCNSSGPPPGLPTPPLRACYPPPRVCPRGLASSSSATLPPSPRMCMQKGVNTYLVCRQKGGSRGLGWASRGKIKWTPCVVGDVDGRYITSRSI